ncbi:PfkB family carbohydrate kinase [Taklimakanibacter deserti]|uniref:PfkB family carbohydrate kinase n=1 Tax=Taklimakanibacter deserti TaxID=2267839 RepID=UPI000E6467A9
MSVRIATVGDNCIDHYLPPVDRKLVGGNAVNVAVNLLRLGHQAAYFGAVGEDAEGLRTRTVLARLGVDVTAVKVITPGRTSLTVIATTPDGDRHFVAEDFGVCRGYRPDDQDLQRLKAMKHVHIGWLDDAGATKRALAQAGVSVSQDLSVNAEPRNIAPDSLAIAFVSCDGDDAEARSVLDRTLAQGALAAVVMRGPRGSLACAGGDVFRGTALPVVVRDTTGAGDSFISGFLAAHVTGKPVADCLAGGHDAAARTCQIFGGFEQD